MDKTKNIYYVYALFRPDGIPCYIGKGKGKRWLHCGVSNPHLARIIKQAAAAGLGIPRIKIRENLSEDEAFQIEIALIAAIGRVSVGGPLVNMTDGGDGIINLPEESRAKMRVAAKNRPPDHYDGVRIAARRMAGIPKSKSHRANISKGRTGIIFSPAHCDAISKSMKIKSEQPDYKPSLLIRLAKGRRKPRGEKARENIRVGVTEAWKRRRANGTNKFGPMSDEKRASCCAAQRSRYQKLRDEGAIVITKASRIVVLDGIEMNLAEACRRKNINHEKVRTRIKRGMDPLEAINLG